jgi:putative transcriptional regulator
MDLHPPFLLLAMPSLQGDVFAKSVVLIVSQDQEGAAGFVLNHRSRDPEEGQAVMKAELRDASGQSLEAFHHDLFWGGPVREDSLFCIHDAGPLVSSDLSLGQGLVLSQEPDGFQRALSLEKGGGHLRFFLGTAGWEPGQLEQEIHQGLWYPIAFDQQRISDWIFPRWADDNGHAGVEFWESLLREAGLDPRLMGASGSGSLN